MVCCSVKQCGVEKNIEAIVSHTMSFQRARLRVSPSGELAVAHGRNGVFPSRSRMGPWRKLSGLSCSRPLSTQALVVSGYDISLRNSRSALEASFAQRPYRV
jgi:hypothetical protein